MGLERLGNKQAWTIYSSVLSHIGLFGQRGGGSVGDFLAWPLDIQEAVKQAIFDAPYAAIYKLENDILVFATKNGSDAEKVLYYPQPMPPVLEEKIVARAAVHAQRNLLAYMFLAMQDGWMLMTVIPVMGAIFWFLGNTFYQVSYSNSPYALLIVLRILGVVLEAAGIGMMLGGFVQTWLSRRKLRNILNLLRDLDQKQSILAGLSAP